MRNLPPYCGVLARRSVLALGTVFCLTICLDSVGQGTRYVPLAHAQGADPAVKEDAQVFAPMSYFAANCARCHGPNGAFYGVAFGKNLTDAQLRTVVHDMAAGPGNAPIADRALEAEVAFHRALIAKQPFIIVTEVAEKDGIKTLHGEVTPESTLTVTAAHADIAIKIDEATWEATLPPGTALSDVTLTATQGEVKTILQGGNQLWSHATGGEQK